MSRAIELQGQRVPYTLKRSKRKTIGLRVSGGQLEVSVPQTLPLKFIEHILRERQEWILFKVRETQAEPFLLTDGTTGHVAGQKVVFRLQDCSRAQLQDGVMQLSQTAPHASLREFLAGQGASLLQDRIERWSARIQVQTVKVRITRAQKRWGSMNARGVLALSTGALLLEPDLLDYVIVHELCHLHHLNHSAEYWSCVERFLPDFEDRHMRVKQAGNLLTGLYPA